MRMEPDSFKQNWAMLIPKIRDRWPRLTEEDVAAIDGDIDALASRVHERYGWDRAAVMNELTQLTMLARDAGVDKEGGLPKMGEAADRGRMRRGT